MAYKPGQYTTFRWKPHPSLVRKWPSPTTLSQKGTRAYMNGRTRVIASWNVPRRQSQLGNHRYPADRVAGEAPLLETPSPPPIQVHTSHSCLPLAESHRKVPRHPPGQSAAAWAAKGLWTKEADPPRNGFGDRKAPLPGLWDKQAVFGAQCSYSHQEAIKKGKKEIMHFTFL